MWKFGFMTTGTVGWKSAVRRVAMFLATIEGQSGNPLF